MYSGRTHPRFLQATLALILSSVPFGVSAAQGGAAVSGASRDSAPSAAEMSALARATGVNKANAGSAVLHGKAMKLTPANRPGDKNLAGVGYLGVLENGLAGDETGLPAGQYDVFVANVKGSWVGYAVSNGQVVRRAIRTSVSNTGGSAKPVFSEPGWCVSQGVWYYGLDLKPHWLVTARVCF